MKSTWVVVTALCMITAACASSTDEAPSTSGVQEQPPAASAPEPTPEVSRHAESPVADPPSPRSTPSDATVPPDDAAGIEAPTDTPRTTPATPAGEATRCVDPGGDPWLDGPVATATTLRDGGGDSVTVHAVVYPHPSYEGNPWSQWGQGIVLDDGRHLSAIGDHLGVDGNSYIYVYEHDIRQLTMIADVIDLVDHQPGAWGYGKIHAQMVEGPCDDVYVATYWGTRRNLDYGDGYSGDHLFRLDPRAATIRDLGVPAEQRGIPSMAATSDGRYLFMEAVEPETDTGTLLVFDTATGEVVRSITEPGHDGFRSLAVDDMGRVLWTVGDGRLAVLDPSTGEMTRLTDEMPGRFLRAVVGPDTKGTLVGVTRNPEVFFTIDSGGRMEVLDDAAGYTTSMAVSPDGDTVLYVPDAHGGAWEQGTPLLELDPETGRESVIVELNDLAERQLGLRLGGTYNLTVDADRRLVYIGFNAGEAGEESFGEVVLVIVELP
ncbi:MAG: hypothetical protein RIE08_07865 [Acidimicrobiales bacterium]